MKNCKLSNDLDRWFELSPSRREFLEEHAKHCADCHREWMAIQRLEALLDRGRDGYLGLRYGGERPRWSTVRSPRAVPWYAWILRPAPALAAAALVLATALATDWSWRQGEPPGRLQRVEVPPLPAFSLEDGTREAVAWDVEPPPILDSQDGVGASGALADEPILMARDEGPPPPVTDLPAPRFSKPSGSMFSLTEVRRAVRSELRKPRPSLPPRPPTWRTKFPKRPTVLDAVSSEGQG